MTPEERDALIAELPLATIPALTRDQSAALALVLDEAVRREREACAKLVETLDFLDGCDPEVCNNDHTTVSGYESYFVDCLAAAIRARK
jgi:hypothetical protein